MLWSPPTGGHIPQLSDDPPSIASALQQNKDWVKTGHPLRGLIQKECRNYIRRKGGRPSCGLSSVLPEHIVGFSLSVDGHLIGTSQSPDWPYPESLEVVLAPKGALLELTHPRLKDADDGFRSNDSSKR